MRTIRIGVAALALTTALHAQRDTTMRGMPGMSGMPGMKRDTSRMAMMTMVGPLGVSTDREGSGTTWIPDAVALPSHHGMLGGWSMMLHGFAFAQYDHQSGARGADQFGSLNWAMLMASHPLSGGQLELHWMPSLDVLGVGKCGYPLLLQSGETCNGAPLADRQHPHDVFMELAAEYQRELSKEVAAELYVAPAGEPALGPVAFMHRPSAMDVPEAPLGHHWQDATHISFGVVTAGLFSRTWKLEGSAFNGREPDENRWDIDPIRLDSYSGRLTVNPSATWSFAAGYGFLKTPETSSFNSVGNTTINPNESIHRLTASALYGRALSDGQWSATALWGANISPSTGWSHSLLAETEAVLDEHNTVLARGEWVQKSVSDLALSAPSAGLSPNQLLGVSALSAGYIREITRTLGATVGLGAIGTVNFVPASISTAYGSRTPVGAFVFLRLRAVGERMKPESGMPMNGMMDAGR